MELEAEIHSGFAFKSPLKRGQKRRNTEMKKCKEGFIDRFFVG